MNDINGIASIHEGILDRLSNIREILGIYMKFGFRVFRTYSYTLLYLLQHAQQQLYFWLPRKSYRFMITVYHFGKT